MKDEMRSEITYLFSVELCCFSVQCLEECGSCFRTLAVILVSDFLTGSLIEVTHCVSKAYR